MKLYMGKNWERIWLYEGIEDMESEMGILVKYIIKSGIDCKVYFPMAFVKTTYWEVASIKIPQ